MKTVLSPLLLSLLFFGCISSSVDRGTFVPRKDEPVEIDFERQSDLIIIEAEVNGETGRFIFDNGASLSLINQDFADRARINFNRSSDIRDANNNESTIPEATVDSVLIGEHAFLKTGFYQIDTDAFMPCNEVDGIIGASIINKANWRINFDEKKMYISSTAFRVNGVNLPIKISKNNSSLATISILGISYESKIDLGSTESIKIRKKASDNSFAGLLAEKRIGITSLSANGLGKTDTTYRLADKLPIINSGDTLPAHASIMMKDKLKYFAYIGLDYFDDYSELVINSAEQEYILVNAKNRDDDEDRSYGLVLYLVDGIWSIIQITADDPLLSEIELMDEVFMIDDKPMEQFEGICDYKEYLKMKMIKEESLVITLQDSLRVKLPFRKNIVQRIPSINN